MGRPAKKKAYWEAKKAEEGRQQAILEAEKKRGLYEKIKPYLENLTKQLDPMEAVAVVGATIMVHETIKVVAKAAPKNIFTLLVDPRASFPLGWLLQAQITNVAGGLDWLADLFKPLIPETAPVATEEIWENRLPNHELKELGNELSLWLISFTLAFFLIRNGGQILSSTSDLAGWLTKFAALP